MPEASTPVGCIAVTKSLRSRNTSSPEVPLIVSQSAPSSGAPVSIALTM
jgi:hypothetical protein